MRDAHYTSAPSPSPSNQRGIGLLELMLSLAIIAILLVSATRYYLVTRTAEQVNDAAEMVTSVFAGGQTWLQTYNDLSGLTSIQRLVDILAVPPNFAQQNANPWGGAINTLGNNKDELTVTLTQIPAEACENLFAKIKEKITQVKADSPGCNTADKDLIIIFDLNPQTS